MRRPVAVVLATLAFGLAAAVAVMVLIPEEPASPEPPAPPPASAGGAVQEPTGALVMAPVTTDPVELDRQAHLEEARARYAALRDAFAKGRASSISRLRLEPALREPWPPPARADLACRGLVCRVAPVPAPEGWQGALEGSPAVRRLADRIAFDPDSGASPAYVLLVSREAEAVPAVPGEEFLAGVESALRGSEELAGCLAATRPGTTLELHLQVDGGGLTWRLGAGLDPQVMHCASPALGPIMAAPVPAGTRSATRVVRLERP